MKKIFAFLLLLTANCQLPTVSSAQVISKNGGGHNLVLCADSTIMAWGDNTQAQIGDGTIINRTTPVQVSGLTDVVAVAAGDVQSLAVKSDGTAWAWGRNAEGELGNGTISSYVDTPAQVINITGIISVAGGWYHSLALKNDGTVWAWGYNSGGQLGDSTTTTRTTPVQVKNMSNIIAIAGGGSHTLALKSDSTVWAWGYNCCGQLGDSTYGTDRWTPVQVKGLTGIIAISAGGFHSLALANDGTVWAWGFNGYGQIGDGTTTAALTPIPTFIYATDIAASTGWHSLATDGNTWAWGRNHFGQLGNGTTTQVNTPITNALTPTVTWVGGAAYHSLALKDDGTLWAWGRNLEGELGVGDTIDRLTPVQVAGLCPVMLPVKEIKSTFDVAIYPNPANNELNISVNDNGFPSLRDKKYTASITNILGQPLAQKSFISSIKFNVTTWAKGILFVALQDEKGIRIRTEKVIIQ